MLICRQGRTITGMFRTAPTGVIINEAGLRTAVSVLINRQRRYSLKLLTLPVDNDLRKIIPETIRDGDVHVQPGEQDQSSWEWKSKKPKGLGQRLASSLCKGTSFDASFGIESTERFHEVAFTGKFIISEYSEATSRATIHSEKRDELSF